MISLVLSPFIVMFLLWLLARHEADLSYYTIFYVVTGVSFVSFLTGLASPWIALVVFLIGLPIAIARWCYVSLPKAVLVTILFLGVQLGFSILWRFLLPS